MIPNILTTVRLILVPIFAYLVLVEGNLYGAAMVFLLSGVTDVADGIIARKFNMITNFGKVYDPFVDKLMQLTAVVCLAMEGIIPYWPIVIALCKEITMISIGAILYVKKIVVHSNWYGKAATVIFYAVIFVMILWKGITPVWTTILLIIMIAAMLFAAGGYLMNLINRYEIKEQE